MTEQIKVMGGKKPGTGDVWSSGLTKRIGLVFLPAFMGTVLAAHSNKWAGQ